jgi:uncharacterized protein YdeI (YjbR/CyaY-like superfamily)
MVKTENFEKLEVMSVRQLRDWLELHHSQPESIWLVTFKKNSGDKYVSIPEVLDEILCFGWIDGVRRKLDDQRTMQLIGPRRVQHWAKSYKDRADRLMLEGRMHAAGLHTINGSKRNGLWNFMDDVDALEMPTDLLEALHENPLSLNYFENFPTSSKRFILRWIKIAKTSQTRAERIGMTTRLAAQNKRIAGS